ncbi:ornithine carbamoyltransferase [Candidatus Daviesbacteria bacterium RIFCSPLOWO2_01_FULL_38_10]|uniref:Ornithine carbamoyltransferase n=1 Tax=Candidatus Daviesbacteria bacterium GW2011_GWF2_38_6 TaxID=1618432 RepID=A0A0G0KJL8_9BACT|nr:MAG: Ornithine carbamoyltransferase, catabolic [Candidatus Daviesbacteria bacterium GW2011_GWA2_38_17]KKQ78972.1 MAG: Ornithine carbamoyltransferase, catabolic [Candidatus Daviesbacteria bacterium GW2011_GWF2_38_6]OGE27862.1 MAG: ornithine carbamoyltransferase [Candidatus Daviesbacteria bacterium RIFCSPHIGHO2_02_FULL_39_41]OGE27938.1 MAG: ornithine carbamoyltransferase [Candidatus Daviesbacteria bacterium RIFCSPHIGHO2_01_FULL_38_8b]OGE38971.1 MAG: ornithine carbamoyltransferase [Candidatus D
MIKHFLSITDLTAKEIWQVFALAKRQSKPVLKGKSLAMIFEKPSLRTRLSFEIAMTQLGGHGVYLGPSDIGLEKRESVGDVARVTSSMADMIMARVFKHETVEKLAEYATVPVINGLSDLEHPCQALADLFTIWEIKAKIKGLKIAFVGDGENNVAHSLCLGATMLGATFACGSPKGFWMNKQIVAQAKKFGKVIETVDPKEAAADADIVVTDTWISMGDTDKEKRIKIFKKYQVNQKLMKYAKKDAIFMHCLPAHRGEEVTADVIDGPQSVVFQEAENRLHVQKALLVHLLSPDML